MYVNDNKATSNIYFAYHGSGYVIESSEVSDGINLDITSIKKSSDTIKEEIKDEFTNLYAYLYLEDVNNIYQCIKRLDNAINNSISENRPVRVDKRIKSFNIIPMEL